MLDVLIYDLDGNLKAAYTDDPEGHEIARARDENDDNVALPAFEVPVYDAVNYVSFVNAGTYGPPALVAPAPARKGTEPGAPTAQLDETVLYVNTSLVPLFSLTRVSDEG